MWNTGSSGCESPQADLRVVRRSAHREFQRQRGLLAVAEPPRGLAPKRLGQRGTAPQAIHTAEPLGDKRPAVDLLGHALGLVDDPAFVGVADEELQQHVQRVAPALGVSVQPVEHLRRLGIAGTALEQLASRSDRTRRVPGQQQQIGPLP
jgi:hypothetical protein